MVKGFQNTVEAKQINTMYCTAAGQCILQQPDDKLTRLGWSDKNKIRH